MKQSLKELSELQLRQWLREQNHPAWRSRQIRQWLYQKWVDDFGAMQNIPKDLRRRLADDFLCNSVICRRHQFSDDQSAKYLLELTDGKKVETVFIPAGSRKTVCVSTQVGCPVGCSFCATGRQGFTRDLQSSEIVDQIIFCCRELNHRITNVVLMGMGEPLLNFDSVIAALNTVCAPDTMNLSARHITISTCGIPERIRHLADLGRQWNLSWSLHSADEANRARLIPPRYRFPIRETAEACLYYRRKTGRIITLEYALLENYNESRKDAFKVAALARELKAKVNLIACNPGGGAHRPVSVNAEQRFQRILEDCKVAVTIRQSRGGDIMAACGQLRSDQNGIS